MLGVTLDTCALSVPSSVSFSTCEKDRRLLAAAFVKTSLSFNSHIYNQAAAFIKLCWAPMLKLGKGCFWELFSPEWGAWMEDGDKAPTSPSYCHPWADGVTHWLSSVMAGVQPLTPGYSEFVAMPHVSTLNSNVSATQHTPHGSITVEAARDHVKGTVTVTVVSPTDGVSGYVGLRRVDEATGCGLNLTTAMVDDGTAAAVAAVPVDMVRATPSMASVDAHVFFELPATAGRQHRTTTVTAAFNLDCVDAMNLAPSIQTSSSSGGSSNDKGSNTVDNSNRGSYASSTGRGVPTIAPFRPAAYPATWTVDTTTGGDWIGKYGKAGYSLFAFDEANNTNVAQLPTWVVHLYAGAKSNNEAGVRSKFVGTSTTANAYLADPRASNKGARSLGWTSNTGNYYGADGSQGTVMNVNITAGKKYKLTLYMVSGVQPNAGPDTAAAACPTSGMVSSPCSATKQAIRVMDLETLNPIAPEPLLQSFPGGLYWSLTYDRSVRLRVMPIDGDSGFSAVFFDEV